MDKNRHVIFKSRRFRYEVNTLGIYSTLRREDREHYFKENKSRFA